MANATKQLFDLIYKQEASTFVFGDYCSNVTKPLAETIHHLNLWQVSQFVTETHTNNTLSFILTKSTQLTKTILYILY